MIVVKNRRVACAVTVAPQLRMSFKMAAFVAILAAATWACAQNSTESAQDDSHKHQASTPQGAEMKGMQHDVKPLPPPSTPTLGALQANPQQKLIRLDELEQLALKNNPTLAQAAADRKSTRLNSSHNA